MRVERVLFFQVAAVEGLVGALDLDGDRGLALFADLDLLVVALDGGTVVILLALRNGEQREGGREER